MADMPEQLGYGMWTTVPAGSEEAQKDAAGYTNPNLHRRLTSDTGDTEYAVGIFGLNSYRYVYTPTHDEESDESEIP